MDANLNRAREGLRVAEDVVRFETGSKTLMERFRRERHNLKKCALLLSNGHANHLLSSRDAQRDPGKNNVSPDHSRKSLYNIALANMKRAQESIRVLEEISKIGSGKNARQQKTTRLLANMRFRCYTLEKDISGLLKTRIGK